MGIGFGENIINSFKIDEGGEVREKIMKKIREGKCGSFYIFWFYELFLIEKIMVVMLFFVVFF